MKFPALSLGERAGVRGSSDKQQGERLPAWLGMIKVDLCMTQGTLYVSATV